jgi:hypothetical protein
MAARHFHSVQPGHKSIVIFHSHHQEIRLLPWLDGEWHPNPGRGLDVMQCAPDVGAQQRC